MTNHPHRSKATRTDIYYWALREGAYGAGAKYLGNNRGKARLALAELADAAEASFGLYETAYADVFDLYGVSEKVATYGCGKWERVRHG